MGHCGEAWRWEEGEEGVECWWVENWVLVETDVREL